MWFLGGAFAVAMMLGAASALVAVRVKRIAATSETPQIQEMDAAVTAEAQAAPVELEPIPAESVVEEAAIEEPPKTTVDAAKAHAPPAQRPRIVARDREPLTGREGMLPSEDEQLQQIREAVLYEQWQERRMRRAARRERRNRSNRDLSHLDEIFEGPRRPERP